MVLGALTPVTPSHRNSIVHRCSSGRRLPVRHLQPCLSGGVRPASGDGVERSGVEWSEVESSQSPVKTMGPTHAQRDKHSQSPV